MHKRPRPSAAKDIGDRLKLHRRVVRLDDKDFTVITLRPGTQARYATFFQRYWHIHSDLHGVKLLGRLLWGLSYQRQPGTIVVIEREFIVPNPFDGEPSSPIVLIPQHLAHVSGVALRKLARQLPLRSPSMGTVRWRTHGLASSEEPDRPAAGGQIDHRNGMLVLTGNAAILRSWAGQADRMGNWRMGTDYDYLFGTRYRTELRIDIFNDFHRRVSAATVARREVLAERNTPDPPATLDPAIWHRCVTVRARRGYL